MQIRISTRHGRVSEGTQAKIRTKVERLTRYFERLGAIDVTIDLEHRDTPSVDLKVSVGQKRDFVATAHSDNVMAALDAVVEKMEQQLRKYKERVQGRHRNAGQREYVMGSESEQEEE